MRGSNDVVLTAIVPEHVYEEINDGKNESTVSNNVR